MGLLTGKLKPMAAASCSALMIPLRAGTNTLRMIDSANGENMTLKDISEEQIRRIIELDEARTASEPKDMGTGIELEQMFAANRASMPAKKKLVDFIDALNLPARQELLALYFYGQSSDGITSCRKTSQAQKGLQTSDYLANKPLALALREALNKRARGAGWS
ncbi:MAG TPA: hypothetical protein VG269_15870 [Tepidisphaeraceae bacterium]|nr:hypothetical protein [Tepidisphaeraceae bacterium]